jgi:hypothetical protein
VATPPVFAVLPKYAIIKSLTHNKGRTPVFTKEDLKLQMKEM